MSVIGVVLFVATRMEFFFSIVMRSLLMGKLR